MPTEVSYTGSKVTLRCKNCRWWDPGNFNSGLCRVNPPTVFMDKNFQAYTFFPATMEGDWCGRLEE